MYDPEQFRSDVRGRPVSERQIREFCTPCDRLGDDNLCASRFNSSVDQATYARQSYCDRSVVNGSRGTLSQRGFYEQDWMSYASEIERETLTPEAVAFVRSVSPEALQRAGETVRAEFEGWWGRYLESHQAKFAGISPAKLDEYKYDGHFANVIYILPGNNNAFSHYFSSKRFGSLDIPHGEWRYKDGNRDNTPHSDLYRRLTPRQFSGIVVASILEEGLTVEDVAGLMSRRHIYKESAPLFKAVYPAYVRLRALGFQHYADLF